MGEFKGTKGQWEWGHNSASTEDCYSIEVRTSDSGEIAYLQSDDIYLGPNRTEVLANAALIAASPELLESLQRIMSIFHCPTIDSTSEEYREWYEAKDIAKAAIAKALGQ